MPEFMIEAYQPALSLDDLAGQAECLAAAAGQASRGGRTVRFLRLLFLPVDEICFYLCDAESEQAVGEMALRAGLHFERITAAVEVLPASASE